ncbi:MAG: anthranilate synthase component I family protein [Nitrospira sp.]|jgi:aminodeoxychorismate synthase component I|nr:anthranilate synthase component I family protein [Nitrospira sp.]MDI3466134.1 Para-aminobenzoate synthase, aminase component [Nitrospira sp.]
MPKTLPSSIPFLHGSPSPLILTRLSPCASPFELYAKIASARHPSFLFESGNGQGAMGRYSYFGVDPYQTLYGKGDTFVCRSIEGRMNSGTSPFQHLAHLLNRQRIVRPSDVPPFFGGAVGYLSYDLARKFEKLPSLAFDDLAGPDLEFAFFDLVAAIDHELNRLVLMFCPPLERFLGEPREKLFREGRDRLAEFEARLTRPDKIDTHWNNLGRLTFTPEQEHAVYSQNVSRCQEYIAAGDIYQANLSHRFHVTCEAFSSLGNLQTDLSAYSRLRTLNPSPFSGVLRFDAVRLISSSPERLVRLEGRRADTRPIAGTRPRGGSAFDDRRLIEELLTNEKERAEHVMLVDLERNDLGRVCRFGSVHVDELMTVEQYSHVNHLVSHVAGSLTDHATGFDLLEAMFPGGTITGVPKIRCMEIIEELEPVRRGPYTGSMGYLSWSGDLDFNILIRTLVMRNAAGYLQVGAGIVADSDPAREYEETIHKAQAFFSAFS